MTVSRETSTASGPHPANLKIVGPTRWTVVPAQKGTRAIAAEAWASAQLVGTDGSGERHAGIWPGSLRAAQPRQPQRKEKAATPGWRWLRGAALDLGCRRRRRRRGATTDHRDWPGGYLGGDGLEGVKLTRHLFPGHSDFRTGPTKEGIERINLVCLGHPNAKRTAPTPCFARNPQNPREARVSPSPVVASIHGARTGQRQPRHPRRRSIAGAVTAPANRRFRFPSLDTTATSTPCQGASPRPTINRRSAAGFVRSQGAVHFLPSNRSRTQQPRTWRLGARRCSSRARLAQPASSTASASTYIAEQSGVASTDRSGHSRSA
jgi:hypothetical protein